MPEDAFDITVVIPAKDEELRIPQFLQELIDYCQRGHLRFEIIVVDDGSTDQTAPKVLDLKKTFPGLVLLSLDRNHGKGYAVKQGLLAAHGNIALFMDADGSTPPDEIKKNLKYFQEGYDIVIGSRVVEGSKVQTRFYRKGIGIIFNFIVSTLLLKGIKDSQCGFKMFRKEIIRPLWEKVEIQGFGFDLEVLYLAQKMNYKIKEVPVSWTHVDDSKVYMIKDSWRMLLNIFEIRNRYRHQIS